MLLLSFSHFLVDFTCAFLVANLAESNLVLALILYNFCAFALQMPLGLIVESKFSPLKSASVGIMLIIVAFFFADYAKVALVLAGVGNSLFHLGGGLFVMDKSSSASPLGVFIAPGALGIYLGTFFSASIRIPLMIIMLAVAALLWRMHSPLSEKSTDRTDLNKKCLSIVMLFCVVLLRGFLGVVPAFPWKSQWATVFVITVVLGKMIGGFLADRFGAYKVGLISLVISAVCFLFPEIPLLGLLGMLSFQLTMPITLWAISKLTYKGFGFGLLTFALFLGSTPVLLGISFNMSLTILVVFSLVLFIIGMRKGNLL